MSACKVLDVWRREYIRFCELPLWEVSEHVGTSAWMSGCSDSELEDFTLLAVHTPETVTSLTPWGTLTKIHLLCSTRWGKELFLCLLLLSVTSNRSCPALRMSGLICGIRHDRTEQDQPGLCKMSPVEVTELTIDLKLHKHGCTAEYLPPINLRLNHAPLSASIINHRATESTYSRLNSTSLLISFNTFK